MSLALLRELWVPLVTTLHPVFTAFRDPRHHRAAADG